jgi:hypothetical protein
MLTSIELKNMTDAALPPIRILLAESDPLEVDRIRSTIDPKFHYGITVVNNYRELLDNIARERPQLLMLGKIDKSNYADISTDCHKLRKNLPIFLLCSQGIIIDSFRQLVKTCGLTDAISKDSGSLNQLLAAAEQHAREHPIGKSTDKSRRQHPTTEPLGTSTDLPTPQPSNEDSSEKQEILGRMMLAALEEIVAISNNYFGPLAQGNYWRKAHAHIVDEFPSIQNWSADHFSKLSCDGILDRELSAEDIQGLQIWAKLFVEECERIIIDFGVILNNSDLSPLAKSLFTKS